MTLTVVTSLEPDWLSDVVCLDVEAMGGVEQAILWAQNTAVKEGTLILAALGRKGEDLSELGRYVNGFLSRPEGPEPDWEAAVKPLVIAIRKPQYRDELPPEECGGGVTAEQFAETLAQAALPDSDPRKRD